MQERKFNINGHPNDLVALETAMAYINMLRRDKEAGIVEILVEASSLPPSFTEADGAIIWQEKDGQLEIPIEPVRIGGKRLPVAEFIEDSAAELPILKIELGVNNDGR